jgi:hypothetical protein
MVIEFSMGDYPELSCDINVIPWTLKSRKGRQKI